MFKRFIDLSYLLSDRENFVIRTHDVSLPYIAGMFVFGCAVIMMLFFWQTSIAPAFFYIAVAVIFGITGFVIIQALLHYREVIAVTEYQNAIFSGAVWSDTEFCMILRHDGKLVYLDPRARDYIRKKDAVEDDGLKFLYGAGDFSKESKLTIEKSLNEGVRIDLPVNLMKQKVSKSLVLSLEPIDLVGNNLGQSDETLSLAIDPISRPSGFFLIKIQKQSKTIQQAEVLDEFSVGAFIANKNNEIYYMNEHLRHMLGFGDVVLDEMPVKLQDVFYSAQDSKKLTARRTDWQREVGLKNEKGELVKAYMAVNFKKDTQAKITEKHGIVVIYPEDEIAHQSTDGGETVLHDAYGWLDTLPLACAITDPEGVVKEANGHFYDVVSLPDGKKKGWNIVDTIAPSYREEVTKLIQHSVAGSVDSDEALDVTLVSSGDEEEDEITLGLYAVPITNQFSECQDVILYMVDKTEIKNLEIRFVHSQKMQAVGQLAGGIAHDFNNLLTAMIGFCDLLLLRHKATDQSFPQIMQIKQNANRAANLVRQLLAFSRKQTLQPKLIPVVDALADLSDMLGRIIGEGIELDIIHSQDTGYIKVDKGQLEQVMMNLSVNARDAMDDEGKLTIKTSRISVDRHFKIDKSFVAPEEEEKLGVGDYIMIEVTDTGGGMKKELMKKIFEPFFTTKEIGAGTGLGLSTVYGIIKQTDGHIYVSSEEGKGTTFTIFFRRFGYEEVKKQEEKDKSKQSEQLVDLTGKGTVLLVEDEAPVRIFSSNALVNKGYEVLEASSAVDALDVVKEKGQEIDMIITDVVMPGMSGPAMIEEVVKDFPDIKVIFMSGYGEDAFVNTYGSEREFNFLQKPYSLKQLAQKVKEIMEG